VIIAKDVDDLHSASNNVTKQTALTEKGQTVSGRGDAVNMHDMLTGSDPPGNYSTAGGDTTCGNWTSGGDGSAIVGHHDRIGLKDTRHMKSWNSSHGTRGCSQEALKSTGGAGLLYCFAADEGGNTVRVGARMTREGGRSTGGSGWGTEAQALQGGVTTVQVAEQQDAWFGLPGSHCSKACALTNPSPHAAGVQFESQEAVDMPTEPGSQASPPPRCGCRRRTPRSCSPRRSRWSGTPRHRTARRPPG
jgi:hypothetical protein